MRADLLPAIAAAILLVAGTLCVAQETAGSWEVSVGASGVQTHVWPGVWGDGLALSLGRAYDVHPSAQVAVRVSHAYFPFADATYPYAVPGIPGFRYEMSGDASRLYEASLAFRFIGHTSPLHSVLTVRTGIQVVDVGAVSATTWYEDSPDSRSTHVVGGTGRPRGDAFISMGVGVLLGRDDTPRILFEAASVITFQEDFGWVPLTISVQF